MARWIHHMSQNLKIYFKSYIKKHFEKLSLENKRTKLTLLVIGSIAATNFIFSLFSLHTILSFAVMMGTFLTFLGLVFKKVSDKGLAYWFPPKIRHILLHRSLFDIICDIWFIPDLLRYFRIFFMPFFVKIEPEEAINQFQELSPKAKKIILQKGLVHLFPQFITKIFLSSQRVRKSSIHINGEHSANESQRDSESSPSSKDRQEQIIERKKEIFIPTHNLEHKSKYLLKRPKEIISVRRHHNKDSIIQLNEINSRSEERQVEPRPRSSNQPTFSETWDKLEVFLNRKREEELRARHLPKEPSKKLEFRDYLDVFRNFTMFLSKDQFLSNINGQKLALVFLLSSVSLVIQLLLSKKARKWSYYTLKILGYALGFSLSTGSLSLLAIKLHHRYENNKKIKQELQRLHNPLPENN